MKDERSPDRMNAAGDPSTDNAAALTGTEVNERDKRARPRLFFIILFVLCAAVFLFSLWQIIRIYQNYSQAENEYTGLVQAAGPASHVAPDISFLEDASVDSEETLAEGAIPDHATLLEHNSDYAAWIQVPDTQLSYPVVRGSDNEKYLNYTFEGSYNPAGAIFMDYRNSANLQDYHTILYGHNVKSGLMFGSLASYRTSSYLEEHPYIILYTADTAHYYRVFNVRVCDMYDDGYRIEFTDAADFAAFATGYGAPQGTTNMITLSTCTSGPKTERLLVLAWLEYSVPNEADPGS